MFVAEVDFVPDIMMKLARKELTDSCVGSSDEGSDGGRGGTMAAVLFHVSCFCHCLWMRGARAGGARGMRQKEGVIGKCFFSTTHQDTA